MARPAAFLDRDGTLIRDVGYLADPDKVELLSGMVEALSDLRRRGYVLIIVTNQSGIGRWRITKPQYDAVTRHLLHLLLRRNVHIRAVYFCPHTPWEGCACRKPRPGMFHRAAREHDIDLASSVMFGDKESDRIPEVGLNIQVPKDGPWEPWYPAAATQLLPRP